MKIRYIFKQLPGVILALVFFSQLSFSQTNTFPASGSAGIGTITPNASSALDITSITQGILVPRMAQSDRENIAAPATGLLIFQTNNTPGFYYYNGGAWTAVSTETANRQLSNLLSSTAVNVILQPYADSTVDLGSSFFSWKDIYLDGAVFLDGNRFLASAAGTGAGNTALGTAALLNNTTGFFNTATGYHSLYSNTTGELNTANGYNALYFNTSGIKNTATGYQSLYTNITGKKNTALGYKALYSNITGNHNTACGYRTLNYNTTGGENTACGYRALNSNVTGNDNIALGYHSLFKNTTGTGNTSSGYRSLNSNVTGNGNTASGYLALYRNTGSGNTANGYNALFSNITGSFNTGLGENADAAVDNLSNATALGYAAIVTSSNSIMLGNTSVTSVKAAGDIVIVSDSRFKKNIKSNVPGLEFINALNPVTFNYDIRKLNDYIKPGSKNIDDYQGDKNDNEDPEDENDHEENKINTFTKNTGDAAIANKEKIVYSGFVAQDVQKAAGKLGYDFSGVYKPQNDKDVYGLSYAEFVVPLVKAVQELSKMNNDKDTRIDTLQKQLNDLKTLVLSIQQKQDAWSPCSTAGATMHTYTANITDGASLEQNAPNPFNNSTSIGYTLLQKFTVAQIIITDKAGKTLKAVNISGTGKGKLTVDASVLASGAYNYSLIVDGKLIGTKQMILSR